MQLKTAIVKPSCHCERLKGAKQSLFPEEIASSLTLLAMTLSLNFPKVFGRFFGYMRMQCECV